MEGTSADADQRAICSAATSCREGGNILPPIFAVVARRLWGPKAPIAVEEYTARPDRTCRAWCAETDIPGNMLIAVLRGREGYRVLKEILEPDSPEWWLVIQRERQLAALLEDLLKSVTALE